MFLFALGKYPFGGSDVIAVITIFLIWLLVYWSVVCHVRAGFHRAGWNRARAYHVQHRFHVLSILVSWEDVFASFWRMFSKNFTNWWGVQSTERLEQTIQIRADGLVDSASHTVEMVSEIDQSNFRRLFMIHVRPVVIPCLVINFCFKPVQYGQCFKFNLWTPCIWLHYGLCIFQETLIGTLFMTTFPITTYKVSVVF